jgi:hypothetical protein
MGGWGGAREIYNMTYLLSSLLLSPKLEFSSSGSKGCKFIEDARIGIEGWAGT